MHSWDAFEAHVLRPAGEVTAAFVQANAFNYRAAARYVSRLPYGRNTAISDPLIVMRENRGTCSTKHALLRRLATEQGLAVTLVLGIYEMHGRNTPGVGPILDNYGLATLPEAHCYLRCRGKGIDVTREVGCRSPEAIAQFLHEEEIDAEQIGVYKRDRHRQFLLEWRAECGPASGRSLDELWRIREECIAALCVEVATLR
jgi:hypothetical protein